MKTPAAFAAVAAVILVVTSVGLSAQAQNDPQTASAPPVATVGPVASAWAPAASTPAASTQAASTSTVTTAPVAAGGAADAKLTKEETSQAESVILDKCTRCHGPEPIIALHQGKAEWQSVLDDMGPSADLSKTETALVLDRKSVV